MSEKMTHDGIEYIYDTAIMCKSDNYLRLYDENQNEIISFYNISDWESFEFDPGNNVFFPSSLCDCGSALLSKIYVTGEKHLDPSDFKAIYNSAGTFEYYSCTINIPVVSSNETTCDVFIEFDLENMPDFEYIGVQGNGFVELRTSAVPVDGVQIKKITITRV